MTPTRRLDFAFRLAWTAIAQESAPGSKQQLLSRRHHSPLPSSQPQHLPTSATTHHLISACNSALRLVSLLSSAFFNWPLLVALGLVACPITAVSCRCSSNSPGLPRILCGRRFDASTWVTGLMFRNLRTCWAYKPSVTCQIRTTRVQSLTRQTKAENDFAASLKDRMVWMLLFS